MADPHDYINQQRRQELERAVEHDQGSLLGPFAAGIGVIGLGAVLLKTRLSSGGKTLSNLFNFLGAPRGISLASDIAANVGGSTARSNTTGLRSLLTGSWNAKTQRLHLGPLDLIDDLKTATEVIGLTDRPIAEAFRDRTTEYINRRFSNAGNNTGYFTHGLHRVTIGQVLDEQEKWSRVIGTNQWNTLKKSLDERLVKRDHILDRGIFYSSARDEVIDLRLRNLTSKVVEHPAQKGTFQRVSRFDIFGQGRVLDSIVGSRRRVAVLTGNEAWSGPRYFVDGKIFGYEKTADGYQEMLLAEGRKLRSTGDPFEPIAAARAGQLTLRPNARKGTFGKLLTKFEHATGVGPSFATRPSFLDRFVINPIKRFNAIRSGEAVVYKAPFRREFGAGKIADAVLGHDMPELTTASGAIVPVPGGGVAVPFKDIKGSMFFGLLPKKVGVLFDLVDDYSVIKTSEYQALKSGARRRGRSTITSKDFTVPLPSGGYRISGRSVASDSPLSRYSDVQRDVLTAGGTISKSHRTAYYDVAKSRVLPGATSLRDFGSYLFYRVNDLASMSGLGFAPAKTMVGNMARLAAVPVIGLAALRAFEYADYLAESYTGISPTKLAASAYATLRVLQQKVREYTGIQQGAAALESAFPGSVDSEGATLARSIIAPAWTFAKVASKSGLGVAAAAAGIVEALIGGPSPGQPSSELSEEYTGERKVPVRKGRFWGLGFTSWGGGAPERFDYSWYHKLQSDYRVNSIYGSKDEYWNYHADVFGIPFPTIDNALGIRNLINPYRLEEINYHDRPYMRTEHALTNFPIVGPLLGATIGKLLKPTIERQSDMPLLRAGLADRGLDPEAAELLGMGRLNATAVAFRDPNSTLTTVSRLANVASEPMGLYKFIMEFFGVKFDQGSTPILATSRNIAAPGRALYDTSLGGALGQTELIRRFMLSDYDTPYGRSDQINQLRNNMPTFMPGQASEFEKDKSYFIDFTVGDSYCLSKDTLITCETSYKKTEDLKKGDLIYTHKGNWLPVKCIIPRRVAKKEKCYSLKVSGINNIPLEFSEEHPLYIKRTRNCSFGSGSVCRPVRNFKGFCDDKQPKVYSGLGRPSQGCGRFWDNSNLGFIKIKDCLPGDYVVYPIPEESTNISIEYKYLKRDAPRLKEYLVSGKIELDEDLSWVLGLYIAEGSTGKGSNNKPLQLIFSMSSSEVDVLQKIGNIIEEKFDKPGTISIRGGSAELVISSTKIAQIFDSWAPGNLYSKTIPDFIFNTTNKNKISFVIGACLGDGHISDNRVVYECANQNLIFAFRRLLFSLGVPASYNDRDRIDSRTSTRTSSYSFTIHSYNIANWDLVRFCYKQNHFTKSYSRQPAVDNFSDGVYVYQRIIAIEEIKLDYVYSIEIDTDDSFCVFDFATHNSKIADGESRLPGKGYESLNELHSGIAGEYSEVDRFLILSDVAPWSDAYKRYESKVRNMNLDPKWAKKVEQALLQREQVLGVDTRYKRHEEEIADLNEASIFRGLYSMVRSAYDTVTHDVLAEIPYIGSKLFPFRSPYEQYRKTQIEGAEFASWDRPWEAIMRPMFYDVATEDPATAAMKGAGIGFLLSGPMRWFNPLRGTVGGASLVSPHMGTVVGGAGAAAAISVGRVGMGYGQDMIPGHIQAESDAINYMDMLTYTKYRSMEQLALDEGRSDVASNMRSMARKTMVAANNPLTMRSTFPRSTEKKYFDYFSQIGDQSMREQILGGTTPYMSRALQSTYSQNYPSMTQADQEAELFLQNQQIPTTDWLGYHPAVSTKSMKLKMIEHGFNGVSDDFHRFGFYETHKNELLNRLPDLYNQELVFTQSPIHQSYNQFLVNHARKIRDSFKSHEVLTRSTPYGAVNNVSSYTDRSPDTLMYVDSYMSR